VENEYIFTKINGKTIKLKFDTGATISTLKDKGLLDSLKISGKGRETSFQTAAKKRSKGHYYRTNLDLNSMSLKNYEILVYKSPKLKLDCFSGLTDYDGLLGLDVFGDRKLSLELNYENGYIAPVDLSKKPLQGFNELKDVSFENGQIFIPGKMQGKKVQLHFDTGASSSFLMLTKNFNIDTTGVDSQQYKSSFITSGNSFVPSNTKLFKNLDFKLSGLDISKNLVSQSEKLNHHVLGLEFIKNYNWIIDFKNEKMYAKKFSEFDPNDFFEKIGELKKSTIAVAINNQLTVIYSKSEKFYSGAVIQSVEGEKVTADNICAMQKLLLDNKENFGKLAIELKE
jgi:predicted aspartyl protease